MIFYYAFADCGAQMDVPQDFGDFSTFFFSVIRGPFLTFFYIFLFSSFPGQLGSTRCCWLQANHREHMVGYLFLWEKPFHEWGPRRAQRYLEDGKYGNEIRPYMQLFFSGWYCPMGDGSDGRSNQIALWWQEAFFSTISHVELYTVATGVHLRVFDITTRIFARVNVRTINFINDPWLGQIADGTCPIATDGGKTLDS